ncbi:hypothetical protein MKD33_16765, partial [Chromobacterium piscinae]
MGPHLL